MDQVVMLELFCGVDLHYKKSSFCFMDETGGIKKQVEINTDKNEIQNLINSCSDFKINYAFEAGGMTRYFHRIVNVGANTQNIHVVHPGKFKIITESKHKNDKEDSKKLAKHLLKDNLPYPVYLKSDKARQLQILLNIRERRVRTKTKIIQQAKSIIRELGVKLSSNRMTSNRGFFNAVESVKNSEFEYEILKEMYQNYCLEAGQVKEIEKRIEQHVEKENGEDYRRLLTIPGIGPVTAATVLSVVDEIGRFDTADQFSCYCGLVPSEYSSGTKVIHGRITKEGSKRLRVLLIQCAWVIARIKKNEDERMGRLKKKFYRISVKQKNSGRAVTAVARHLSRIIFGVLKHKEDYRSTLNVTAEKLAA